MFMRNIFSRVIIFWFVFSGCAWASSVSIPVIVEISKRTCSLKVPPKVDLGLLSIGKIMSHSPVSIEIECPEYMLSQIYLKTNKLRQGTTVEAEMSHTGTRLWFTESKHDKINLEGNVPICIGSSILRECTITPHSFSDDKVKPGNGYNLITVTLGYG